MTTRVTFHTQVHFRCSSKGRKNLQPGALPAAPAMPGRVPRVARLMALAIRFDELIRSGGVSGQAELARLGHVTRARVTQIMSLLQLAPDIQEELLLLPRFERGQEPFLERDVRAIALVLDWRKQRVLWRQLCAKQGAL